VTVGERKLIKRTAVYTAKELARLLAKGYNVLVKDGHGVAKRIAKKVWKDPLQHPGHFINKAGKWGLPHFSRSGG
jgi:accessory colonization factor AcfC